MKQRTIVAVILVIFVLIAGIQAFQLNSLKEKVSEGGIGVSSSSSKVTSLSSGSGKEVSSLPSNIKDLPQMVGGC